MHKAKACIVACMDFRFQKKIQSYLLKNNLHGFCDRIIIAGGSRDFIYPVEKEDGLYAWKQLGLSIKLHDPDEIIFIDHQDCGGYAQDGTIPSGLPLEDDKLAHKKFLIELQKKFKKKYPDIKIKLLYLNLENELDGGLEFFDILEQEDNLNKATS